MNRRLAGDASLNAPLRDDGEGGSEWQDWLVDESANQETVLVESEEMDYRMAAAEERDGRAERRASGTSSRRGASPTSPITLEELAEEFGVSRERVRQIEVRAFEKLQEAVLARVRPLEQPPALATTA